MIVVIVVATVVAADIFPVAVAAVAVDVAAVWQSCVSGIR